jgi:hypothetical protein
LAEGLDFAAQGCVFVSISDWYLMLNLQAAFGMIGGALAVTGVPVAGAARASRFHKWMADISLQSRSKDDDQG